MKKNISINLFGTLYSIDEDAYQLLDGYLQSMKRGFAGQEGGEEIADDIEHRVAELLWAKREAGMQVVDLATVKEIMASIGNPDQIGGQADDTGHDPTDNPYAAAAHKAASQAREAWQQAQSALSGRRLFRHPTDRMLGGVCAGLSHYFRWGDPVLWRLLFVLLFALKGMGLLLYLVLWLVVPEARTPEEHLQMKGEEFTPENLQEELLRQQQQPRPAAPSAAGGCLKALLLLFLVGPIATVLLVLVVALPVLFGLSAAALPATLMGPSDQQFLQSVLDLSPMESGIFWSGIITLVALLTGLLALAVRWVRGGRKRMSASLVWLLLALFTLGGVWTLYALTYTGTHTLVKLKAHKRAFLADRTKFTEADKAYLRQTGFTVLANSTHRCTAQGEHPTGDTALRYLDTYDEDGPIFTAERVDTLSPGRYRLTALARAEDEGAWVYVSLGKSAYEAGADGAWRAFVQVPATANIGGSLWEWASGKKLPSAVPGLAPSTRQDSLRHTYTLANGGQGFGWNRIAQEFTVTKDGPRTVHYGITTDPEVHGGEYPECKYLSATDFHIEPTGDAK